MLRFADNGRLRPFRIDKACGLFDMTILSLKLIETTGVKGPGGTGFYTDGQFVFYPPVEAEVALTHLRSGLRPKLGNIIRTGFKSDMTGTVQTSHCLGSSLTL